MDRSLCVLAACLAMGAAFAGCAASGSPFEPIPNAGWKPGFAFGHTIEMTGSGSATFEVDGEIQETEAPFEDMPAGQRPMGAFRVLDATTIDGVPVYLAITHQRTLVAFRQADLKQLATGLTTVNGVHQEMNLGPDGHGDHPLLRFPLELGDTWRTQVRDNGNGMGMGGISVTVESTVHGMESVEGPYGPVDAVRIEHEFLFEEEAMEDMMAAAAAEEGVDLESLSIDLSASRVVHYAPSLHNVVRDESEASTEVYARFTEGGKDIEVDMDLEMTAIIRLAEAVLEEKPATPLAQAHTAKAPRLPNIVPPEGQDGVGIQVRASETVVNAAQSPHVEVTAEASGLRDVLLRLVDAAGNVVEQDRGTSAEWTIGTPGRYTIEAVGEADGYTLQDTTELIAGYEATLPAGCPFATVMSMSCDTVHLPVGPGIVSLEVAAVRQPLAVEEGMGTLYLYDGQTFMDAPMQGDEAVVRVTQFDERFMFDDWQAWYQPTVGVLEDVEYRILLDYGQPEQTPQGGAAGLLMARSAETLAGTWSRPLLPG